MHPQDPRPRPLTRPSGRTAPRAPAPVRGLLSAASRLAPGPTARWAERRFLTPVRHPAGERHRETWARATPEPLPFAGRELAGWRWGEEGPAVWLVHGWSGSARQLAALAPSLAAEGFRVRAWDLPAHGASPGRSTHLGELVQVLAAAAARFGPPEAIVAHSFGAAAATVALADGLPARRAAFVAPPVELEGFADLFARFLGLSPRVRRLLQERVERRVGRPWRELTPALLAPRLGAVSLLVLHDAEDHEVGVDHGERLAAAWPGSELVVTTGLGHNRILRDPEVVERVRGFVAGEREATLRESVG